MRNQVTIPSDMLWSDLCMNMNLHVQRFDWWSDVTPLQRKRQSNIRVCVQYLFSLYGFCSMYLEGTFPGWALRFSPPLFPTQSSQEGLCSGSRPRGTQIQHSGPWETSQHSSAGRPHPHLTFRGCRCIVMPGITLVFESRFFRNDYFWLPLFGKCGFTLTAICFKEFLWFETTWVTDIFHTNEKWHDVMTTNGSTDHVVHLFLHFTKKTKTKKSTETYYSDLQWWNRCQYE